MSNQQQGQQGWVPNIFNDGKLAIQGKPIADGGWNSRLRIKTRENNPALEVNTGMKDKRERLIKHDVPMSPRVFEEFLYVLEVVASFKGKTSFELENWGYTWRWNSQTNKSERSENVEVICMMSIYKTEAGLIGIDFSFNRGKTVVPFVFTSDDYHKWMVNGNYMEEGDTSKIAVISWVRIIREVYAQMYIREWKEPNWQKEKRLERMAKATGQGGGYNSGGGNYNRGGGGGFQGGGQNQGHQQQQQQSQQQQGGFGGQQASAGADAAFADSFGSSMDFGDDPM